MPDTNDSPPVPAGDTHAAAGRDRETPVPKPSDGFRTAPLLEHRYPDIEDDEDDEDDEE